MRSALLLVFSAACRIGFDPVEEPDAGGVYVGPGLEFSTACTDGWLCSIDCREATSCMVDCSSAKECIIACPVTGCEVSGCTETLCRVTCGTAGVATRLGDTMTCQ